MTNTSDKLVFLADCHSDIDAKIIKGILESNEIFCFIQGENHHQMLGMIGSYIQMRIMVPESQLAEAQSIFAEFQNSQSQSNQETSLDSEDSEDSDETYTPPLAPPPTLADLKKKQKLAALLSIFLTFGTGHLITENYVTFFLLASTEMFCVLAMSFNLEPSWADNGIFISSMTLLMLVDLIGSQIRMAWRIHQFKKINLKKTLHRKLFSDQNKRLALISLIATTILTTR